MKSKIFKITLGIIIILNFSSCSSLYKEKTYAKETVSFQDGENKLVGVLTMPKSPGPHPCIVNIHGDGPQTRDYDGALDLFFQEFAKAGWCFLSWDKAGIGDSTGDWLTQSMSDRSDEALAAIDYLQSRDDVIADNIGLFGYSQAGWVLPLAASRSNKVAFIIPVSAAVDVIEQGLYYKHNLWIKEGLSQEQITEYLEYFKRYDSPKNYEAYLKWHQKNAPKGYGRAMDKRRWGFDQMLVGVNAKEALRQTTQPVLAIWGAYDLHVDPEKNFAIYKEELAKAGNENVTLKIFPKANHSLLKVSKRQFTISGPASLWISLKYIFLEKDAFADGYFELLISWLEKRKINPDIKKRKNIKF